MEAEGGDREKIQGDHLSEMVAQEARPVLGRETMWPSDHVFGDGSLGHGEAQLEQLAVDAGGAPQWIGSGHVPNQGDSLWSHALASRFTRPALPTPEEAKTLPMPVDDGIRLDEPKGIPPSVPSE